MRRRWLIPGVILLMILLTASAGAMEFRDVPEAAEAMEVRGAPETAETAEAPEAAEAMETTETTESAEAIGVTGSAEAANITGACDIKVCSSSKGPSVMTDGKYTSYWESSKMRHPYVTIHSETPMYGLYLCFRSMPASFEIQELRGTEEEGNREWVMLAPGDTRFYHTFYPLDGAKWIRIYCTQEGYHKMGFNEVFVFGEGEIPDWVQRWEEPEEKADILFFSAHPDDELIFLGGAIPTYAAELKKRVVVAYLSYSNTTRRSEALNGLWSMGVRHYPEFGGFRDSYSKTAKEAYHTLGKDKVLNWVTEMFRKHQPEVVVTHDINGEYGHGQHRMMADAAIQAYELAAEPEKYPESAAVYGVWQAKKLYVHLYGEESVQTRFDWNVPLESLGGKTGLEAAIGAYAMHKTQERAEVRINGKWTPLSVETTGSAFSNTTFGLYASQVGPDETHTDFLEHIGTGNSPEE